MNQIILCLYIITLTFANSAYGNSSGIEEHRRELCMLLPKEDHCVELKKVFGAPPPNSVSNIENINVCTNNACKAVNEFPKPGSLPSGSYIQTNQTLTITTKTGAKKIWNGSGSFSPVGDEGFDGKGISYDVEFDQLHKFFWVQGHFDEGGSDEWIAYETGKRYVFYGQPRVSPDGNHLLVPEESMEDVKQLFVRIYSLKNNEIVELAKFDMMAEKIGGQFVWVNSDEIAIISHVLRNHTFQDVIAARIRKAAGKWILLKEKDSGA